MSLRTFPGAKGEVQLKDDNRSMANPEWRVDADRGRRKVYGRIVGIKVALTFGLILALAHPVAGQLKSPGERFQEATEAMKQGRLDEAASGFASVITAAPSFAEAHLNLGLVLEEQGKNEEAIGSLKSALQLKPRLRGANLFLGIAQYRLNHFDLAAASLKKEVLYDPSSASAWMWLGVVQLADGKPEEAAQSLDKAAKLDPKNVEVLYNRGRAHLLLSKNSYEQMYKADPNSWRVHQVLAQAYAESGRHLEAIAEYKDALQKSSGHPGLHEELGSEYLATNKLDEAEAEFAAEVKGDPDNAFALFKLGATQIEKGKAEEGKASIESALRKNPHLQNGSFYYLGRADMQLGHNDQAISALNRATTSDSEPEIVEQAWYQLGVVYRRLHRLDEARQAMAIFQKLKDAEVEDLQRKFKSKQNPDPPEPPGNP